jgi:putative salt-induced outer membrane protein
VKFLNSTLIICTASLASFGLQAEETTSPWNAEAELGFIKTSGNSDTESLNMKAKAVNETSIRTYTGKLETARTKNSSTVTGERYFASGKGEYNLDESAFLFALLTYEDDRFSGYDYQATETVGYGRHLIKQDDLSLKAELGAGAKQADLTTGTSESGSIVRVGADLKWKISKSATFTEELSIESSSDNTITKSVTGLKTRIDESLSSKITYTWKNNSDVAPTIKDTDTELAVTLVYSF